MKYSIQKPAVTTHHHLINQRAIYHHCVLLWMWISLLKCSNAFKTSFSVNISQIVCSHLTITLGYNINIFGVICVVEHSSPATIQHIFRSIHPYKLPLVVAWTVSPSCEVCVGCRCAHLLGAFLWVRGYDYLQGGMICCSSGQPLLYHVASHHLTQLAKNILMRPVAVLSFQLRYQGLHPINIPDARPRSLQDRTSSKAHHHIIISSIRIMLKRTPHSSEDE